MLNVSLIAMCSTFRVILATLSLAKLCVNELVAKALIGTSRTYIRSCSCPEKQLRPERYVVCCCGNHYGNNWTIIEQLNNFSVFFPQIRNFGGSGYKTCIDSAAKKGDMHKPVGLYPCHNQGGNQVINFCWATCPFNMTTNCFDFFLLDSFGYLAGMEKFVAMKLAWITLVEMSFFIRATDLKEINCGLMMIM